MKGVDKQSEGAIEDGASLKGAGVGFGKGGGDFPESCERPVLRAREMA
jgi:hypothetical protein